VKKSKTAAPFAPLLGYQPIAVKRLLSRECERAVAHPDFFTPSSPVYFIGCGRKKK